MIGVVALLDLFLRVAQVASRRKSTIKRVVT